MWGPDGTVVEVRCIPDGSALPSLVAALGPSGFPVRIDEAIHEDVVVERPTGRCEDPLEAVTLRPSWRTTRYRWNERNELAGVRVEYDGVCYGAVLEVEPEPGVLWRTGRCFDGRDVGLWYEADAAAEHVIATDHGDGRGLAVVLPPIVPLKIELVSP
ncbi:MAG: hypothetical protein KC635_22780 [Myxococcales bacterium]|nr:hypothetical protein [Myxococcales bacterium]